MKRVLFSAVLAGAMVAAGIPAVAQTATNSPSTTPSTTQEQGGKHWRHHGKHMARMAKKLNLSQDQQDKLKPIFEKRHEQAQAIKNDSSLTSDQKKEKMQALRQDTMAQVNGILTPEQQQQWQQMKAKHHHEKGSEQENSAPKGQ